MARLAQRGEIWLVDLGMMAKERPCLILSVSFHDNERALATYVPRTTSLRGGRFEVVHNAPLFKPGAFDAQNIGTVPIVKLIKPLARLSDAHLKQVEVAVCDWLGLKP
jgi:mRNA interferase MazF